MSQFQQFQPEQIQPPKKKHTVRNVLLSIAGAFVLVMGGCFAVVASIGEGVDKAVESATPTADPAGDAPLDKPTDTTPPAVPEPTEAPVDDKVAKVGATQWFTYEDGLKVQVSKLTKFTISEVAAGGKPGSPGVIVTVTIKNTGKVKFDPTMAQVALATGPNGTVAEEVFDSQYESGFEAGIPAGKTATAKFGFAVPKTHYKELLVEVTPSWEHTGADFEGSVK